MTATWLKQLDIFITTPPQTMGYQLIRRPRTGGRHGGRTAEFLGPDINLQTSTHIDCNN